MESRYRTNLVFYKNDRETWVNVLASQGDYFNTRMMYTRQLVEWCEAQILFKGMLLSGGLTPPPGAVWEAISQSKYRQPDQSA